jgi:hypothetical protein
MVRNDRRRERRLQRAHYEEVARNHNIKLAAKRLLEDQQREEQTAAQVTEGQASDIQECEEASDNLRKAPESEAAPRAVRSGSGAA